MDSSRPPPIGFELQNDPSQAHITQIDVGFNSPPHPEVTPATQPLYPSPHDQTEVPMPPPPPIGFEGQNAEAEADGTVDNHKLNQQVFITILHSLAL